MENMWQKPHPNNWHVDRQPNQDEVERCTSTSPTHSSNINGPAPKQSTTQTEPGEVHMTRVDAPQPTGGVEADKLDGLLDQLAEQMKYRHTADLIVRSDGIDHRYEADYLDGLPRLVRRVIAAERTKAYEQAIDDALALPASDLASEWAEQIAELRGKSQP